MSAEIGPYVPSFSVAPQFSKVPGIEEVRFDPERCAELLTHPLIGIRPKYLPYLHIFVRPDYKLGYTPEERKALRKRVPKDFNIAGCAEKLIESDYYHNFDYDKDVLITLIYGAGYSMGKLLCHEAVHAKTLLHETNNSVVDMMTYLRKIFVPSEYLAREKAEETLADAAMKDTALKGLRKGVIEIVRRRK
jgi:hypothetical protein